ncbi:MAG: MFS transporter [Microthrixaceae bacterium]
MADSEISGDAERLLTLRFVTVVSSGLFYFMSLGMQLPTVPKFIEGPLGGSDLAVGVLVGSFSLGAVAIRPMAGRLGDKLGRRMLIIAGALLVAISVLLYNVIATTIGLFAARLLGGVGEAAFFVGAGTMVTDLAPVSRRGEAISYWSVAVYGGLAFGPSLGERLLAGDHYGRVWTVAAGLAVVSAIIGVMTRETAVLTGEYAPAPLINRTAVGPGIVLFLGMMGLAGFGAFVPLYVSGIGLEDSSGVFLLYGCTILGVRIVGARIPDRIGTLRAGSLATAASAVGLLVIAAVPTVTGLYVGTFIFSLGMSLLYPSMLTMALAGVPDNERGSAVGTISSFFDLSQGVGAAILGVSVSLGGYRSAFITAAAMAVVAMLLLRGRVDLRFRRSDAPVIAPGPTPP